MYLPNGSRPQAGFGVRIGERIKWHAFSIGIVGLILAALLGALHVLDRVAPRDPAPAEQRAERPVSDSPNGTPLRPFGAALSPRSATPERASHFGATVQAPWIAPPSVSSATSIADRDDVASLVDVASPPSARRSR